MSLLVWLACAAGRDSAVSSPGTPSPPTDATVPTDPTGDNTPSTPTDTLCAEVDAFVPVFASEIATFAAQDDLSPGPSGSVVFVGSSSIRRWEGLARAYTDHTPRQRGVGGAQLGEIAQSAEGLILRHDPRAVVVYAGTNDVDAGVPAEVVVDRFRCLRARIATRLGADRPVLFIGIVPNPARWDQWPTAEAVNAAVRALAEADPGLVYVDVPSAFLATGSPPAADLFVGDGLHLSDAGYALWDGVLRPAVDALGVATTPVEPGSRPLPVGTRILVDLGPSNPEDGEPTPSPDYLGQTWNNWHPLDGDGVILPGEHLDGLVDDAGAPTGLDLVVTGGFGVNGRSNGGLLWPDTDLLGDLAVGSATGDYGYSTAEDQTGGLQLRGLDPGQRYTLRLFAARDEAEVRRTTYTLRGATEAAVSLQTSGPGAGADGATTNDDTVAELPAVAPDAWGHLYLDVALSEGSYAYLSLLEIDVVAP